MNYKSNANDVFEEIQTIPTWVIIAFIFTISALSIALFPEKNIQKIALNQQRTELVTYFYLSNLVKKKPDDINLRIALTNQQIGLEKWNEAQIEIENIAKNPQYTTQASILEFQLYFTQFFIAKDKEEKQKLYALAQEKIKNLATQTIPQEKLMELGDAALGLDLPTTALAFYGQLQGITDPSVLQKLGLVSLAAGQYIRSADYYFNAASYEKSLAKKRETIKLGFSSLQQGGAFNEIQNKMNTLPYEIINDKPMLRYLIQLALASGQTKLANKYAIMLLQYDGKNKK